MKTGESNDNNNNRGISNLMHCVAQQHYTVVVNRELSIMLHSGGPPHQQSVLQAYQQPEPQNNPFSSLNVCVYPCVCVCVSQPKGEGLVEDVQRSRPCCVFADNYWQEDLQRHHGHCQQCQLLLGNPGLHQLQACHRIRSRETNLTYAKKTHKRNFDCYSMQIQRQILPKKRSHTLAVRSRTQKVKTVGILIIETSNL